MNRAQRARQRELAMSDESLRKELDALVAKHVSKRELTQEEKDYALTLEA